MKYLELIEHKTLAGQEYSITAYPGPGAYLLPNGGIVVIYAMTGSPMPAMITIQPGHGIRIAGKTGDTSASGDIDVHRLFDQMIKLTKT